MELLKLPLSENALTFTHANNTLIVNYSKPGAVLQAASPSINLLPFQELLAIQCSKYVSKLAPKI
eukprot:1153346-Pelagomonas_calceolata.AAC.2